MPNDKVIDRIRKLIAKSVSSTFDAEKAAFAVEAVRLIEIHNVQLGAAPISRRPVVRAPIVWTPRPNWEPGTAPANGRCAVCRHPYRKGEPVWIKEGHGVIHIRWPEPPCGDGENEVLW